MTVAAAYVAVFIASLILIVFILLHSGRGGGLSDMFGGMSNLSGGTDGEDGPTDAAVFRAELAQTVVPFGRFYEYPGIPSARLFTHQQGDCFF